MVVIKLQLRKEKEKQKQVLVIAKVSNMFCFGDQDTIESVIMFRIDSRTTKRKEIIVDAVVKCH
jgi:MFS superfamily sulfate permease-like transporter